MAVVKNSNQRHVQLSGDLFVVLKIKIWYIDDDRAYRPKSNLETVVLYVRNVITITYIVSSVVSEKV